MNNTVMNDEPVVKVGILTAHIIKFVLNGHFSCNGSAIEQGSHHVSFENGSIMLDGTPATEVTITPDDYDNCSFDLHNVTIGLHFHWQREESQRFKGSLKFIVENDAVTAVNILPVEDYLLSVISSEMNATSSLELLKAHAVISRSWLLAQIDHELKETNEHPEQIDNKADEMVKWYDHTDHKNYDVCADDHCQRYQGITRNSTPAVQQAINATRGQVLMYDGKLCDARFSKCCGGMTEEFENCWEDVHHPYLEAVRDNSDETALPDLTKEENAALWILSSPKAFCNTTDEKVLRQVLNNYDQSTTDFYRWRVEYSQKELSQLIKEKLSIDFGDIIDLCPVERGSSGRLYKLKIVGTQCSFTVGKELEIRRALSPTHLYSSAFIVEKHDISPDGTPQKFVLRGAGWGHGVGLCQIGAAMMGEKGYSYKQILTHYFKNAKIIDLHETRN